MQDRLSDEAIEWLARLRAHDVTDQETADFAHWLNHSPAHKHAFDEATALWHLSAGIDAAHATALPARSRHSHRRLQWTAGLATAASVLLLGIVLLIDSGAKSYETGVGEQQRIVLEDGSIMYLNTDTQLRVRYDDEAREVELQRGEAWFDVQRAPSRPFLVQGGQARIKVLGTAFVVRETAGYTRVGVSHGRVQVTPLNSGVSHRNLVVGDLATVYDSSVIDASFDPEQELSWRAGQLIYRNTRLEDLLADLSRYVPANMNLNATSALADRRVSAVLFVDDQEAMLEALAHIAPIKWKQISPQSIIVTARSEAP
ncbi:MAG: FecR domain-containing protein [Pseudomonadota bacterium]